MPRAAKVDASKDLGPKAAAGAGAAKSRAKAKTVAKGRTSEAAKEPAPAKKAAAKPTDKAAKATKAPAKQAAAHAPRKAKGGPTLDKFLHEQLGLLEDERATYEAQAADLKAQADQMAQEMEPGDIQFDDESGEGGTANIDRERDLALSAQARLAVDEIDHAIAKIGGGTYGKCESCGQPIPRARLKALPQARLCVACKSGGLSRR